MTKTALCIGVFALMILIFPNDTFAVALEKSPGSDPGKESQPTATGVETTPFIPPEGILVEEEELDLSQPITLEQCIEIALKRSPSMKTAKLDLVLEDMNVNDARSRYLPQIDTSGRYQFTDKVDFGWEKENYDATVSARYIIWDHGQREGSLSQAKSRRESRHSQYNRNIQSLIFDVIRAYYGVLEAEKLIGVDRQLLDQSRQNVEKIKAFVEAGIAIESDIATARVQQANDELAVINDMNNFELAKADLAVLMGLEPNTPFNLVDAPDYEKYILTGDIETRQISIGDAVSQALISRHDVAEQKASIAVLETALTLAQLELWPKITADCGYDVWLDDYLRERDALKKYKSWDVSAGVSYPLFDGGRTRRTVQRADIALQKANENMTELERSITLEVYQAYLNLEKAKKSLDIASVQVEDAKMSLDVVQGRYDQQMIILLELLEAQVRYARSLTNQVRAFYDYKVAERTLDRAIGVLR